ncbi:MAG: hypothetical protein R2729_32205 [Bryobacteraceae bacterium]
MRFMIVLMSFAMTGCIGSCGREKNTTATKVTEEGVDVKKDPFGVLGALSGAAKDAENFQKELENMPEVEPVHFSTLVEVLKDRDGWEAEPAKGSTSTMGTFKTSEAHRTYRQAGGDGRVDVTIQDWAFNRAVYLPFIMSSRFSQESSDGYNKGIKLGEDPGRDEYKTASQRGERSYLRHKRYHTKIRIQKLPDSAFDDWTGFLQDTELPVK